MIQPKNKLHNISPPQLIVQYKFIIQNIVKKKFDILVFDVSTTLVYQFYLRVVKMVKRQWLMFKKINGI